MMNSDEVALHRPTIVADQNAVPFRRESQHRIIGKASQPNIICGLEINVGLAPQYRHYNVFIEIGVGLESRFHRGIVSRALSKRRNRSGLVLLASAFNCLP